jgi:hypothetical protein
MNCPICQSILIKTNNFIDCPIKNEILEDNHYWLMENIGSMISINEYSIHNSFKKGTSEFRKYSGRSNKIIKILPLMSDKEAVEKLPRIIKLLAFM